MIFADLETLPVVIVAAITFVIVLFLALLWLLTRDPGVLRTRFGFYVERERFARYTPSSEQETREWPKQD
jgi:hypothetical protein